MQRMNRRRFIGNAAAALGAATGSRALGAAPDDRVRLAHIGCGSIGMHNARIVTDLGQADYVAVCDPDVDRLHAAAREIGDRQGRRPATYQDFRRVLDRGDVDAVWVSTPDHWHALITILACMAGKDVFVEKPISHNIVEGRRMVQAARRYDRIVQAGTQQRSGPHMKAATDYVRSGALGTVTLCKAWVVSHQVDLGHPADCEPPASVDYDLWLGPAPKRPFNPNRFHYNWRWFWDYAGGKCADWGIHLMDMIHWGMGVDAPMAASSEGSRRALDDNCETPDTQMVLFEYPGFICTWEHREANAYPVDGYGHGMAFYGTKGTLLMDRSGWKVLSEGQSIPEPPSGSGSDGQMYVDHAAHFLECIRTRQTPRSDIEIAHRTTSALHLGNIAYRVKRRVVWDRERETIVGDDEACELLGREYRKPWELPRV